MTKNFRPGIARLEKRLQKDRFDGTFIAWDSDYPSGSPDHEHAPFGFKPFCFNAARQQGHDLILWLDASLRIKRPLQTVFDLIKRDGFLFFSEDHSIGEYCKDAALAPLKISREESFAMPSCWACAIGLDLSKPIAQQFLSQWMALAVDGITFPGAKWSGVRGWPATLSDDPRVKGHRYDQTAASVVALRLGMIPWHSNQVFRYFFENERDYIRPVNEPTLASAWARLKLRLKNLLKLPGGLPPS